MVHWISSKCRENFVAVFASSVWNVLKKAIVQRNIHWENFCGSMKICKNRTRVKLFSRLIFIVYGMQEDVLELGGTQILEMVWCITVYINTIIIMFE